MLPVRVTEITQDGPPERDPETGELLAPPPAATEDGEPLGRPATPDREPAR